MADTFSEACRFRGLPRGFDSLGADISGACFLSWQNPEGHQPIADEFVDMPTRLKDWTRLRIEKPLHNIRNPFRCGLQPVLVEINNIRKPDHKRATM